MFETRIQKRFSGGLQFSTNFQVARQMDALTRLNPSDAKMYKRVSNLDHPVKVLVSGSYQLPVGKGKRFLNLNGTAGTIVQGVAGGWKLAGVYTYEVATPLSWGNVIYYGGDLNYNARNLSKAFNTTLFNTVSSQQLSNNIRTFPVAFSNLRADSLNNLDVSLAKEFGLGKESRKLEVRFEAFNALNRAQFSGPNLTPASLTFGTISSQSNSPRTVQTGIRVVW